MRLLWLAIFLITFFLAADMEGSSLRSRDKRLSLNLVSTLHKFKHRCMTDLQMWVISYPDRQSLLSCAQQFRKWRKPLALDNFCVTSLRPRRGEGHNMENLLLRQTKAGLLWRTAVTLEWTCWPQAPEKTASLLEKKRSKEAYHFLIPRNISSQDIGKSLPQSPCDSELCKPRGPASAFDRRGLRVAPSGIMQPAFCLALNTVFWVGVPLLLICKPWWCAADACLPLKACSVDDPLSSMLSQHQPAWNESLAFVPSCQK